MKRYLYAQATGKLKRLLVDRYEFWVYRLLRNGLESGDIFCRDSVRFRSFEDDLLDDQRWQQKDKLIDEAGLIILKQSIQAHLAELGELLEARIAEVNRRIASGENEHLQIKKRGPYSRWTLEYPRGTEPVNHPFFDALKQVAIGSILHFVNQHCRFIDAFDHVLGRYAKQGADDRMIVACLIAWGTNLGLGRMGAKSPTSVTPSSPPRRITSSASKRLKRPMTVSAMASPSYPSFAITISMKPCTQAAMDRSSRPGYLPSMPAIHPSTSGSRKGLCLTP